MLGCYAFVSLSNFAVQFVLVYFLLCKVTEDPACTLLPGGDWSTDPLAAAEIIVCSYHEVCACVWWAFRIVCVSSCVRFYVQICIFAYFCMILRVSVCLCSACGCMCVCSAYHCTGCAHTVEMIAANLPFTIHNMRTYTQSNRLALCQSERRLSYTHSYVRD